MNLDVPGNGQPLQPNPTTSAGPRGVPPRSGQAPKRRPEPQRPPALRNSALKSTPIPSRGNPNSEFQPPRFRAGAPDYPLPALINLGFASLEGRAYPRAGLN